MNIVRFGSTLALIGGALLLAGCLDRSNGPNPRYSASSGYAHMSSTGPMQSRGRGEPDCGRNGTFQNGKCVGNEMHDIPLTGAQKETFASCERIITRTVQKGNRLVQQQKGISCERPH